MNFQILVARYHECPNWTKEYSDILIYNKGPPITDPSMNSKQLPKNVGREGHTYYTYICENYDNLPDYVIFLQGNPFDHTPYLADRIKEFKESPRDFAFLSRSIDKSTFERQRNGHWECYKLYDNYEKIFGVKCDIKAECEFGHGAQFAVSKQAILLRPRAFYENIVRMLEYAVNPHEGYDVERLHKYIFCG